MTEETICFCGTSFPRRTNKKYCGPPCAKEASRAIKREWAKLPHVKAQRKIYNRNWIERPGHREHRKRYMLLYMRKYRADKPQRTWAEYYAEKGK